LSAGSQWIFWDSICRLFGYQECILCILCYWCACKTPVNYNGDL